MKICELIIIFSDNINSNIILIYININNKNLSDVLLSHPFAVMKELGKYLSIISRFVLIINLLKIKINNIKTSINVNTFNVNDILNNSIKGFITSLLSRALLILNWSSLGLGNSGLFEVFDLKLLFNKIFAASNPILV